MTTESQKTIKEENKWNKLIDESRKLIESTYPIDDKRWEAYKILKKVAREKKEKVGRKTEGLFLKQKIVDLLKKFKIKCPSMKDLVEEYNHRYLEGCSVKEEVRFQGGFNFGQSLMKEQLLKEIEELK